MNEIPKIEDIYRAGGRIKDKARITPVLSSSNINKITGAEIFFKCENFQKVGAFKFRGATNAIMSIDETDLKKGVATHSSGNHAQALALAAKEMEIPATIVMPNNSPKVKKEAVKSYGAEIIFCEPTLQAREETLNKVIEEKGSTFIHPYDNYDIICGQATASMELIREIGNLNIVMTPVGGGGLLAGTASFVKSFSTNTEVYAAEPAGADDAYKSFKKGEIVPSKNPNTICDGLLTSLGELNFFIIQKLVDDILTVEDDIIIKAMKLIWERMKVIVEPSAAVPLAVILQHPNKFKGKKVGIILSGGNVDLDNLPWL